jgi:glycosyltransferase involved in cell wall biosynthesis
MHHMIFGQLDPTRHTVGGIPGFVRDLVRFAPETETFSIVGVASGGGEDLGSWHRVGIGARTARFMPVARLDPADQARRVPHSVRFLSGVLRFRPRSNGALLHSHRAEVGAALSLLHRSGDHVQFLHGDTREAFAHRTETFWRFAPRAYLAVESFAVRNAIRTVVMSRSGHERLREISDRVVLGTNWFDGTDFYPPEHTGDREMRVAWAGRLEPPKDPLRAVEVLRRLRDRGVHFTAWIAGSGTLETRVRLAIAQSGLSETVELRGSLQPRELADELRGSTVFLMTSLWEGFPRSAAEALACGVPIVSTEVGELGVLVEDGRNGYLSRDGDPDALAELLVRSTTLERGSSVSRTVRHLEARHVVPELLDELRGAVGS